MISLTVSDKIWTKSNEESHRFLVASLRRPQANMAISRRLLEATDFGKFYIWCNQMGFDRLFAWIMVSISFWRGSVERLQDKPPLVDRMGADFHGCYISLTGLGVQQHCWCASHHLVLLNTCTDKAHPHRLKESYPVVGDSLAHAQRRNLWATI